MPICTPFLSTKSVLFSMAHICSLISRICLPSRLIPSTSRISCPIRSPPAWKAAPFGWMEMILGRGCFVLAPPSMAMPKVEEHLGTWIVCRPTRMWDKGGSGRRAGWKKVWLKMRQYFEKLRNQFIQAKRTADILLSIFKSIYCFFSYIFIRNFWLYFFILCP